MAKFLSEYLRTAKRRIEPEYAFTVGTAKDPPFKATDADTHTYIRTIKTYKYIWHKFSPPYIKLILFRNTCKHTNDAATNGTLNSKTITKHLFSVTQP